MESPCPPPLVPRGVVRLGDASPLPLPLPLPLLGAGVAGTSESSFFVFFFFFFSRVAGAAATLGFTPKGPVKFLPIDLLLMKLKGNVNTIP